MATMTRAQMEAEINAGRSVLYDRQVITAIADLPAQDDIDARPATISASGNTSDEVDMRGEVPCGLIFPAAVVGTSVSFAVSVGGSDYPIYNEDGTLYTVDVVESAYVPLFPPSFMGVESMKIVSNQTETSEISILIVTREIA